MFSTNVGVPAVVLWLKCEPSLTTGKPGGIWAGLKGKVLGRGRAREVLQIVGSKYWLRGLQSSPTARLEREEDGSTRAWPLVSGSRQPPTTAGQSLAELTDTLG